MFLLAYELGADGNKWDHLSCVQLIFIQNFGLPDEWLHPGRAKIPRAEDSSHKDPHNVVKVKHSKIKLYSLNKNSILSECLVRAGQPFQERGNQDEEDTIICMTEKLTQVKDWLRLNDFIEQS